MKEIKKWYYYKGGAEKIPRWIWWTFRKIKRNDNKVVYRNGNWLTISSRACEEDIDRSSQKKVVSNRFKCSHTDYAYITLRKNRYLSQLAESRVYLWENMLVIGNPYNKAPLTALLLFYTTGYCKVRYTVVGKTKECDFTKESSFCRNHMVAVYGLYPDSCNRVELQLIDTQGSVIKEKTIFINTEQLPEELQHVVRVRKKSELSVIPFIMIGGGHGITTCAFDSNGDIRFYLSKKGKAYGIYPLSEGQFLYTEKYIGIPSYLIPQGAKYYNMNYLGGVNKTYFTPKGIHHCAVEMKPSGNYLMGSSSFYGSVENAVAEVDCNTGKIVKMPGAK